MHRGFLHLSQPMIGRAARVFAIGLLCFLSTISSGADTLVLSEAHLAGTDQLAVEDLFADYRSYLVNVDHIRELQPIFHGDYTVKLADCTELTLSRNYREKLLEPFC